MRIISNTPPGDNLCGVCPATNAGTAQMLAHEFLQAWELQAADALLLALGNLQTDQTTRLIRVEHVSHCWEIECYMNHRTVLFRFKEAIASGKKRGSVFTRNFSYHLNRHRCSTNTSRMKICVRLTIIYSETKLSTRKDMTPKMRPHYRWAVN